MDRSESSNDLFEGVDDDDDDDDFTTVGWRWTGIPLKLYINISMKQLI